MTVVSLAIGALRVPIFSRTSNLSTTEAGLGPGCSY
jgi:hypothetical protein